MFNFFRKNKYSKKLVEQWNVLGSKYAEEVNEMVALGEKIGWDNWEGENPVDNRSHLADKVFKLLKKANSSGTVGEFRDNFPPANTPFSEHLKTKGQGIQHMHFIENDKIVFMTGTSYHGRQAYLLIDTVVTELDSSIDAIGKSKRNNVFAVLADNCIVTTQGWQGEIIQTFVLKGARDLKVEELLPFNDGKKILLNTCDGMFMIAIDDEIMFHPVPYKEEAEEDDEEHVWDPRIDMGNATLSNDNRYIVVGDQGADHRILTQDLVQIGEVGAQSSYPHYCIFSADDSQLVTNSCHFYNGITISVSTQNIDGLKVEAYTESDQYEVIDEEMRVYVAVTTKDLYIFGDAYGYIRAIDKEGKAVWRHFVGYNISGLTLSDDDKSLWVGTYAGVVHRLTLGGGHRDTHTIGNANHYEEFRVLCWKEEPVLIW